MTMRIGVNVNYAGGGRTFGVDELVEQVAGIQRQGLAYAAFAQLQGIDALTVITVTGRAVPDIELVTAVIPVYPRHPVSLAQQALTTHDATNGRLTLGIGLSHKPVVENTWGMSFARPLEYMREYLAILQPLLHGQPSTYRGKRLTGQVQLNLAPITPPQVIVAALGENMLRLTAEQADGTVTWMVGPKTLREHVTPVLREAAAQVGRPEPRIMVGLPISVTDDVAAARARAARGFERYGQLPSYKAMLDREGVDGPAEVAIIGTEDEIEERLAEIEAAGATDFTANVFGSADDQQRTFALLRARVPHDRPATV
jgi:5,10-methylenetetrahydromethanopterin reductase